MAARARHASLTQSAAELWGSVEYRRLAERLAPVHDKFVERLTIRRGERVLDVATGTGGVAIRAARAGAEVTGVDIAEPLLDVARASAEGASIRFDVGDAQNLPYDDAAFDVVASCFGAIFAPDHRAVARELARVTRRRLGLTAWRPNEGLGELYRRFGVDSPEGREPFRWGTDGYAEELLGEAFDLTVEPGTWVLEAADGEGIWQLWSTSAPPFKAMLAGMEPEQLEAFHQAYVAYCEQFREDAAVRVPREYLLILGTRR
ncbi:MAG: class I SAM-dependent methyltransferase [Gaiellaceae bacterium]